jgi:hypothetical protein
MLKPSFMVESSLEVSYILVKLGKCLILLEKPNPYLKVVAIASFVAW